MLYWVREALLITSIGWTLWAWRHIAPPRTKLFILVAVIAGSALTVEVVGLLTTIRRVNNSILYNLFTYGEFLLQLCMVYAYRQSWKRAIITGGLFGTIIWCWCLSRYDIRDFLYVEALLGYAVILVVLCLGALWHLASTSATALHRMPEFWLFGGLLVYHGSLLPVLSSIHYLFASDDRLASWLWYIPPLLCILRYSCFTKACALEAEARRA